MRVPCPQPHSNSYASSKLRPQYGVDIRDRDLPQETAQAHALHFAKGCYLGQEIVERIRSRGRCIAGSRRSGLRATVR